MNAKNAHKRILLNENKSGKVDYCETCDVVELEMGPVSVRLHAQDLALFRALIQDAETHLKYYQLEKSKLETEMLGVNIVH